METQEQSSASSKKPMSLGGIYKWGKWEQAKSYARGLRQASDNVQAGMNHAWAMAAKATGTDSPKGGKQMPAEDETAYIDSPVTNHIHHAAPSSLGKILLGAGLLATGIGIPAGAWMIASGAKDATTKPSDPPVVSVPVEKPSERPAVTIGGYELRLGK